MFIFTYVGHSLTAVQTLNVIEVIITIVSEIFLRFRKTTALRNIWRFNYYNVT
jgi:hypothetical protein